MEQEYTTSTGYRIGYGLLAIVLACFTPLVFTTGHDGDFSTHPVLFIPLLLGFAGAALIVLNLVKRKVVISNERVLYTSIWGTKELDSKDIKGFRVGEKAVYIESLTDGRPKVMIRDYASIGDIKEVIGWLGDKYTDLNKADYEASEKAILEDSSLGFTEEERARKLKNARKYTMVYGFIGIGLFFFPLILHITSRYLAIVLLISPLVGIVMIAQGKGLIRLFTKKNSAYASIFMGLFFPALGLLMQSITNQEILDFGKVWPPAAVVGLVMLFILYFIAIKRVKTDVFGEIFFALLISGIYAFGSILEVNSCFDNSTAQVYPVTVIDHYVTHGKSTSYHITIDQWRPDVSSENITVSSSFYDEAPIGSKVNVNLKKGALNIAWYYVTQ